MEAAPELLARLADRVAPVSLAQDRVLPVRVPLDALFPERGLVRGRLFACRGSAATTVALALATEPVRAGAWMAVVDLPTFGADAAVEFGIPLDRVVRIDSSVSSGGADPASWVDLVGAAVDGFDLVLATVPAAIGERPPAAVRKLIARLQRRGSVVLLVGDPGRLGVDGEVTVERDVWDGVHDGSGHLRRRVIGLAAAGRRIPGARRVELCVVGGPSRVELTVADFAAAVSAPGGSGAVAAEPFRPRLVAG